MSLQSDAVTLPDDLCNDSRTTFSIVTTCLTTIFLCAWTSIHPNIPNIKRHSNQPNTYQRHMNHQILVFWDKTKLMFVALIAPELMTLWAIRQRNAAGKMAEKYSDYGWTRTHTFFALMGGFAFHDNDRKFLYHLWDPKFCQHAKDSGDQKTQEAKLKELLSKENTESPSSPNTTPKRQQYSCLLEYCAGRGYITITEEHIQQDISQSDFIAKVVTLVQTLQFITRCIARGVTKLPITELEFLTLGFAALNIITYTLWWDKPHRVGSPIPVIIDPQPPRPPAAQEKRSNCCLIALLVTTYREWVSGSIPAFAERIKVDYYNANKFPTWHLLFILPTRAFARLFGQALHGDASKPSGAPERGNLFTGSTIGEGKLVYAAAYSAAVGLGVFHCIPIMLHFRSFPIHHIDQELWTIFAIMVTTLPLGVGMMHVLTHDPNSKSSVPLPGLAVYIFSFIYAVARIVLMVLAIKQLTDLPDAALQDIAWVNYLPRIVL